MRAEQGPGATHCGRVLGRLQAKAMGPSLNLYFALCILHSSAQQRASNAKCKMQSEKCKVKNDAPLSQLYALGCCCVTQ
jgi:hypothetical protein